jgi:hypothetical protein
VGERIKPRVEPTGETLGRGRIPYEPTTWATEPVRCRPFQGSTVVNRTIPGFRAVRFTLGFMLTPAPLAQPRFIYRTINFS